MKNIKRFLLSNLFWLLVVNIFLIFIWFREGLMFAGGEGGIPFYNLEKTFKLYAFTWRDYSAGHPSLVDLTRIPFFGFLKAFSSLSLPGFTLQAFIFFFLMATGTISVYLLIKETLGEDIGDKFKAKLGLVKYTPFIGAVFYLLNPFSMTQIWGRGLYMQFFAFALIPAFLLLFILGLKRSSLIFAFLAVIVSFIFSPSFTNPSIVYSLWTPVFVYLVYYLIRFRKDRSKVFFASGFFISFLGLWLLSNLWWIFPFLKFGNEIFVQFLNFSEANLGTLRGVSRQFPLAFLIRLIHKGPFFEAKYYGEIYGTPLFIFLSWIIPVVFLFSLRIFKKSKHFAFFLSLFLFSLFITLGANPPLGWLFVWLFKNISYLQPLRNPYEKFGLVLLLAYTPFFALGVVSVSQKVYMSIKNKTPTIKEIRPAQITGLILILVSFVYVWPMWTGHFAGGLKINPWIKVPDYYKNADEWIRQQEPNARIIQLPLNPGDGVLYKWEHPYQGVEPSDFLFSNTSIGRNISFDKVFYNVLLERFGKLQKNVFGPDPDISRSEFRSQHFYEELAKLNVVYIILHNDIDWKFSGLDSPEETANYLAKQKNIKKVKTFGQLDIYRVEIPDQIDRVYSPDSETSFVKVNPTFYKVEINEAKNPVSLYLLELFDPNWEAYVDGQQIKSHTRVFSYANAWRIDKGGSFNVLIKYAPQDAVIRSWKITKLVLLAAILLLLLEFLKRKWLTKH